MGGFFGRGPWLARWAIWSLAALFPMRSVAQGEYVTKTLSIPNITEEIWVMATPMSGSELVTIAVPVAPCYDCEDGSNAIFVSPVSLDAVAVRPSFFPSVF